RCFKRTNGKPAFFAKGKAAYVCVCFRTIVQHISNPEVEVGKHQVGEINSVALLTPISIEIVDSCSGNIKRLKGDVPGFLILSFLLTRRHRCWLRCRRG